ncbi:hypothetical protein ACWGQL_14215 [Streptomyces lydicus]|uniref:hypothetical protein n=1 Tax=Streptomyces lydicus TaxID=47763 RepID=UPI0036FEB1D9
MLRAERAATEAMAALRAEQESTLRVGTTVTDPAPALHTHLAVRPGPPSRRLAAFLDACNSLERAESPRVRGGAEPVP